MKDGDYKLTVMLSRHIRAPAGLVVKGLEIDLVMQFFHQNVGQSAFLGLEVLPEIGHGANITNVLAVGRLDAADKQQRGLEEALVRDTALKLLRHLLQLVTEWVS